MQLISEVVNNGMLERLFNLTVNGETVPGVIWTPGNSSAGLPIVLMGHGGSQHKKFVGIVSRAQKYTRDLGFAVAAIDMPGHGDRPQTEQGARFVAELQKRMAESQPVGEVMAQEMARLALQVVPEWQAALDAVQSLADVGSGGLVGYLGVSMGGAIGVPLVAAEQRISAAVIGLTGLLPGHKTVADAAARINVPIEFVIQWNDEFISRESSLALFDAFGSQEKTLHANPGGHATRTPTWEAESWEQFFCRHLQPKQNEPA